MDYFTNSIISFTLTLPPLFLFSSSLLFSLPLSSFFLFYPLFPSSSSILFFPSLSSSPLSSSFSSPLLRLPLFSVFLSSLFPSLLCLLLFLPLFSVFLSSLSYPLILFLPLFSVSLSSLFFYLLTLSGMGWGFQAGGEVTDFILVLATAGT